jgi:hypothetical protein
MPKPRSGSKQKKLADHPKTTSRQPTRSDLARERAFAALSAMRRGTTLSRAAKENGVSPRTVKGYAGSALIQKHTGGRIRATKNDQLIRYLQIPGRFGPVDITVRGSAAASEFARYKAAVNRLLRGDADAMAEWYGKKIQGIELITSSDALIRLAHKDLLPYALYRSLAGGGA